jgi:hypothetical protein
MHPYDRVVVEPSRMLKDFCELAHWDKALDSRGWTNGFHVIKSRALLRCAAVESALDSPSILERWHMGQPSRLFMAAALVAFVILAFSVGLAKHPSDLLAPIPFNPLLFLVVVVFYVVPTALALFRNCTATVWIAALNILLGWTLFGWVIALGWEASGKVRRLQLSTPTRSIRSVPGH